MKKTIIAFVTVLLCTSAYAQGEFPFSDYLDKTHEQFMAEGFRYDKKRNMYTKKQSTRISQALVLAIFGMTSDIPSDSDFGLYIRGARTGVAYVHVTFYNDRQYVAMVKYLKESGIDYTEVDLTKGSYITFDLDGVEGTLKRQMHIGSITSGDYTTNELYNSYSLTLHTGQKPWSPWQERQIKKHNTPYTVSGLALTEKEREKFPTVDLLSVMANTWVNDYTIGAVERMSVTERIEMLTVDELRYTRVNHTTGAETDVVMTCTVDGNCLRANYKHHYDGSVAEGDGLDMAMYFRPESVMWLVKNGNYGDVKKLFAR